MTNGIKEHIRTVPDFPKPGIQYRDITSLLVVPGAISRVVEAFRERFDGKFDAVAAIESRGFIFGAPLAASCGAKLTLVRKAGTLPRRTLKRSYSLEYGSGTLEVHAEDIARGDRILLVDDLIATGGTLQAAAELILEAGATPAGIAAVIDLPDLGGSAALRENVPEVLTLVEFEGE